MDLTSTIAAIASAPGRAERSLLRISGDATNEVVGRVFSSLPCVNRGSFRLQGTVDVTGLSPCPADLQFWPGSRSYTGQPTAELSVPGSPPLVDLVLQSVLDAGARPARPGEFTLRAFLAGKLDLAQAEAVLGVIDAFDHEELSTALKQLAGGLSGAVVSVRNELADLLADLEAGLDFVDEDIEFISQDDLLRRLGEATGSIESLLSQVDQRFQSAGRHKVALAGLPNAGKSTLFNALTSDSLAIVSSIEGTTRDYVSRQINCDGIPVELIDTAGWEFEQSGISDLAQQFREEQVSEADLVVWCSPADFEGRRREVDQELFRTVAAHHPAIRISTRTDLVANSAPVAGGSDAAEGRPVSAVTGQGLSELARDIASTLSELHRGARHFVASTAARSRNSLRNAAESLQTAAEVAASGAGDELTSMEIRNALDALGEIVGAVYTEDLLDRVFSRFCIGK